jgi:hypothetical protein
VHDYGLAAQLAANAHAADAGWDRRSPANGLTQNLVQVALDISLSAYPVFCSILKQLMP